MSENSPIAPPNGWADKHGMWVNDGGGRASVSPQGQKGRYYASIEAPGRDTEGQAQTDRLAMIHALDASTIATPELLEALDRLGTQPGPLVARLKEGFEVLVAERKEMLRRAARAEVEMERLPTEAEQTRLHNLCDRIGAPGGQSLNQRLGWAFEKLGAQLKAVDEAPERKAAPQPQHVQATLENGRILAVEMALDEVKAPANESLVERIRGLGAIKTQAQTAMLHFEAQVRQALNIGPPSDSDVKPDTTPKRIAEIVRARSVLMLEERDQRVALAKQVEVLTRQISQEREQAINRLMLWMSGDQCDVASELLDQVVRAVEEGTVTADDANDARRSRRALAALVLNVDFHGDCIPF